MYAGGQGGWRHMIIDGDILGWNELQNPHMNKEDDT